MSEPPGPQGVAATPLTLPRRRVLIVDDDHDFVDMEAVLLESMRQAVYRAYDGGSAVAAVREFRPEVVLLDIDMPGLHGIDVAREMRKLTVTRRALIIAQTGLAGAEYRLALRAAGFDGYLAKPPSIREIAEILRRPGDNKTWF